MVEDVEGLRDELQPGPFTEVNGARYTRIQRDNGRHTEGVTSEAGCPLRAAVAVVIQIGVDQGRVRLAALSIEDPRDLPTLGQDLEEAVVNALSIVQVPNAAEDEAMAHVIVAVAAIEAYVVGVVDHFSVVGSGYDSRGVGNVIDHMAPGVRAEHAEVVRESFVDLQDHSVVVRGGIALKLEDAAEPGKGTAAGQLLKGQHLPGSVYHDRGWDLGHRLIDIASALDMNAVHAQVSNRNGCVRGYLVFQPQVVLLNVRLLVVLGENKNRRRRQGGAGGNGTSRNLLRSATSNVWVRGRQGRGNRCVEGQRLHVDSVV